MMLRRLLPLPLILLAILLASPGATAQPGKAAGTSRAVYYRPSGSTTWSLFGHYSTESAVKDVVAHLRRTGNEVEVRTADRPVAPAPPRPTTNLLPASETTSYAKCAEIFNLMAAQRDIAFRFPIDGCYARAHLMCERMIQRGLKPRKIWSVANGDSLYARTKHNPNGYVTWGYHVAPVLRIRNADGTQRWYVIDPSLFPKPATVTMWMNAQMRTPSSPKPYLTISKIGLGPFWLDRKRKPGTGYWPGPDPSGGVHSHALATMRKYKPWEGRIPPKGVVWAHESDEDLLRVAAVDGPTLFSPWPTCYASPARSRAEEEHESLP
jgi:hypothetical protein